MGLGVVHRLALRRRSLQPHLRPGSGHGLGAASLHEGVRAGHPLWHERGGRSGERHPPTAPAPRTAQPAPRTAHRAPRTAHHALRTTHSAPRTPHGFSSQIQREIEEHGTDEDKECLHYILHEKAGGSVARFPNGVRDEGRNSETFEDFCNHKTCMACNLEPSHVLALRLYSTAVYKSINGPLRDTKRTGPHPLAITVSFVDEGVRRLRAIGASEDGAIASVDLWRGMRNAEMPDEFLSLGGTELAPMSTTTSLKVAMEYCASKSALILRLNTSSFMERGADISFLSAFPTEKEVLYPPLTFMRATGAKQTVTVGDGSVTIMEVIPSM